MLQYMRKHATSFFIKVALAVIVLSFVLWGGFSYQERKENRIASVNGQYILRDDFQKTLDRLREDIRRATGNAPTPEETAALKLKERALSLLVNDTLLIQAAHSLGLTVDDETLRNTILTFPAFRRNGQFDEGLYRMILNQNRLSTTDFEEGFRRDLTLNRLKGIVDRTCKVSEAEARLLYDYIHEERVVYFTEFAPKDYEPPGKPDSAALKEYFASHQEEYRIPESRKIDYVLFSPESFESKVKAGEREVRAFYDREGSRYMEPKKVRVRQILVRVPPNPTVDDLEKAAGKAAGYLKMIRDGADFGEIALRYSQGPAATNRGEIGFITRAEVIKPMGDLAFSLKPGEVGGPVRSAYGFHIMKAEEVKPATLKPFDTVKDQVKKDLIQDESARMALDAAEEFYDSLALGTDLRKAAADFGYQVKEAVAVRGRPIQGVGAAPELVAAIFDVEPGELTPLFEAQGKRVLAQLKEVVPSRLPELKEVKSKAEAGYNALEGRRLALDAAQKMQDDLAKTRDFALAADKANVKVNEKGPFSREEGLLGISKDPGLIEQVFGLTEKSPIPQKVMTAGGKFYVFALKKEIPASEKEFEENKRELIARYTDGKRRLRFEEFVAMLRERAEIEILQEL